MKLFFEAIIKFSLGVVLVGAMLFLPAWTLDYPYVWLFMGLLFVPMFMAGIVMLVKSPALLQRRLDAKEKQSTQKGVIALSGLMFPCGFVLSALDYRFSWSHVPAWLVVLASVLFIAGYVLFAFVLVQNEYLSRTIKVEEGQRVVDTGLYGVVRHPMYFATLLMFLPMPIILGSLWGLVLFALYPVIIAIRIMDEEKLLCAELEGYEEYKKKVKYRLLPFIW